MACKTKNGRYRVDMVLTEQEYLPLEAIAKETGLTLSDVIKLKLKGFEPRRAA